MFDSTIGELEDKFDYKAYCELLELRDMPPVTLLIFLTRSASYQYAVKNYPDLSVDDAKAALFTEESLSHKRLPSIEYGMRRYVNRQIKPCCGGSEPK